MTNVLPLRPLAVDMTPNYFNLCRVVTTTGYPALVEKYPAVAAIPGNDWEYYASILAFRACLDHLKKQNKSEEAKHAEYDAAVASFRDLYPDFLPGLQEFIKMVDEPKTMENDDLQRTAVWLAANLFRKGGDDLTDDQFRIGMASAYLIISSIQSALDL